MNRRTIVATGFALSIFGSLSLAVSPARAATEAPFTQAAFNEAQKAGKPILVDTFAPWCPTCRAQAPIIKSAAQSMDNKDLVIFKIDFDSQKAEQRGLNIRSQSTLIAFKGMTEVGRSVGATDRASINALIAKTRP